MAATDIESIPSSPFLPSTSVHDTKARWVHRELAPGQGVCHGGTLIEVSPTSVISHLQASGTQDCGTLDTIATIGFEDTVAFKQGLENREYKSLGASDREQDQENTLSRSRKPFSKWMRTLQKRATRRQGQLGWEESYAPYGVDADGPSSLTGGSLHHRYSSSVSSFGFVAAVKSASISIASASVMTRSRRNTLRSSRGHSRADRSSKASAAGARLSEDSYCSDRPTFLDPLVMERSLQRRRIIEELITTEESYIGDVRFLMNVYVTILASLPTLPAGLRSSINRNLTDIVELHEEILGELHRVVPDSEYTQPEVSSHVGQAEPGVRGHQRWRSLDAVPEDRDGISWLPGIPGMLADPQTAAEVAKIFSRKMNRFFIYEEYGAKYELMIKDVGSAHRTMPRWQSYQKGLEVLAASLGPANNQNDHARKSLTIGDLLVKPIQRVCKYPLLFAELLKYTSVVDCPYSHMEVENALIRLREATAEINRATDDAHVKSVLEKTWVLQDRLVFANQQLDAASKNRIRGFGHVQLCGVLHVCWQTKEGVSGQYMVALLYREWLCLATASRFDQIYTIQACIALNNIKVEELDNGRGLQCHTAPYSWKIVFICDHQLYELILSACTPKEEAEWRGRLSSQPVSENQDQLQPVLFSSLSLNMKSLGTVFGKPGTIARRISIHRATTVGPKTPLCQVILKNTSVVKDPPSSGRTINSQINRSQSLLTTNNRIPVLAPSRGERARLETLLSDVWTRDVLPFPGITARSRSEHLVRTSASSMMRKLSVTSIAGSFSKRSLSSASQQQQLLLKSCGEGASPVEEEAASGSTIPQIRDINMPISAVTMTTMTPPPAACTNSDLPKDEATRSRSLLSVIPDEVERRCAYSPSTCTAAADISYRRRDEGAENIVSGMVRRLERAWSDNNYNHSGSKELVMIGVVDEVAATLRNSSTTTSDSSMPSTTADAQTSCLDLTSPKSGMKGVEADKENVSSASVSGAAMKETVNKERCERSKTRLSSHSHVRGHKLSRGWSKVGVGHREGMVQSLRSLFR
ncbi:hypothetical protein B0H66DRAFT_596931 [Apodospora peruviana]|uniref:DH domain-containing protein n=1 Tax=Apodospora peruviana TaxID=516989 RepID=A0AAE0MF22_9PEZI|nr:hypothetical protein B0H66DRAFT_596931 [Apodospora peruviana]